MFSAQADAFKAEVDDRLDSFIFPWKVWGYKVVKPELHARYKKPIMDRVIDLTVFYEQIMGVRPHKLLVGHEEMAEIMRANRACDMVGYSRPAGALGTLNGMAVFHEPAKHHLECV
jgi:hypothetical protein